MAFANKRAKEEFFNSENNYIDPQYEEMAEGFEDNDEYVVPMVDYLSYRLHRAKIYRNRRRRERDIWWVWIQLKYEGIYVEACTSITPNWWKKLRRTYTPSCTVNM